LASKNKLPENCNGCKLQPIFCNIEEMLPKDSKKWEGFATDCLPLDARACKIDVSEKIHTTTAPDLGRGRPIRERPCWLLV